MSYAKKNPDPPSILPPKYTFSHHHNKVWDFPQKVVLLQAFLGNFSCKIGIKSHIIKIKKKNSLTFSLYGVVKWWKFQLILTEIESADIFDTKYLKMSMSLLYKRSYRYRKLKHTIIFERKSILTFSKKPLLCFPSWRSSSTGSIKIVTPLSYYLLPQWGLPYWMEISYRCQDPWWSMYPWW